MIIKPYHHLAETHSGSVGWEPNSLPHRPVETPAFNGVLGYVPQLARIVVRLSPSCARSADLRRYIDYELDRFAEENNCTVSITKINSRFIFE